MIVLSANVSRWKDIAVRPTGTGEDFATERAASRFPTHYSKLGIPWRRAPGAAPTVPQASDLASGCHGGLPTSRVNELIDVPLPRRNCR